MGSWFYGVVVSHVLVTLCWRLRIALFELLLEAILTSVVINAL